MTCVDVKKGEEIITIIIHVTLKGGNSMRTQTQAPTGGKGDKKQAFNKQS